MKMENLIYHGLPSGKYTLQEIQALEMYIKDNNLYEFEITKDLEIINLKFKNSPIICGFFNINKTSSNFSNITNKQEGATLSGAKYEIKNNKDEIIYTGVTNENGKFDEDVKLKSGEYTICETEAPEGYILDKTIYNFKIEDINGKKIVIDLKNDAIEFKNTKEEKIVKKITAPKLPRTGY